jgi:hypothetical protein
MTLHERASGFETGKSSHGGGGNYDTEQSSHAGGGFGGYEAGPSSQAGGADYKQSIVVMEVEIPIVARLMGMSKMGICITRWRRKIWLE